MLAEEDEKSWNMYFQQALLPAWIKVAFRTVLPWALLAIYYFATQPFDLMKYLAIIFWPVVLMGPFFGISYLIKKKKYQKYLEEGNVS